MRNTLLGIVTTLSAMMLYGCDDKQIPPELLDTIPVIQMIVCRDGESMAIDQNNIKRQDITGFCDGDVETFGNFIFEESN